MLCNKGNMTTILEKIEGKCWMPIRVKPKQEKKLVQYCKAKNVDSYLPVLKRVHRYEKRTAEFFVPMFPGYVFCCIDDDDYNEIVLSNAIVYKIQVNEQEEEELLGELASIHAFEKMASENEVVIKPEIVEGRQVNVSRGALAGTTGVVVRRKGKATITVNVDILGQSATVEIDVGDIDVDV